MAVGHAHTVREGAQGSLPSTQDRVQRRGGSAESALETVNDFVNDSFCCILIISLHKGNFLETGDWAGQPTHTV